MIYDKPFNTNLYFVLYYIIYSERKIKMKQKIYLTLFFEDLTNEIPVKVIENLFFLASIVVL